MNLNKTIGLLMVIVLGLLIAGPKLGALSDQSLLVVKAAPPGQEPTGELEDEGEADDDSQGEDEDETGDVDAGDGAEENVEGDTGGEDVADEEAAADEAAADEADELVIDEARFASDRLEGRFCSATAQVQFKACRDESRVDFLTALAVCLNIADEAARQNCWTEAQAGRQEDRQLCREQRQARQELCQALGEAPYNPGFDPATFDSDFNNLTTPNPYLPLALGYRWQYVGGDEIVTIEVRPETKLIAGVTCLVVNDVVSVAGQVVEDTDDWLAQAQNGDVYYCGEEVKDFEYFGGDNPLLPELTSIDGSFKAGRDGDKAGLLLPQSPVAGQVFRQEWSPGKAEDAVEVLATSYRFGLDPDLDQFVPPALAEQVCAAADCLVTRDFNPLEPDALEYKYYAAGIGRFLEVNRATGEIVQLVSCNVDPRCETLSAPEGE